MRNVANNSKTLVQNQSNLISEEKTQSKRVVLEINNNEAVGGADVWLAVDAEAAPNKGRRIQPGQSAIWSTDGGYIPPQQRITGYSTANAVISIYEEIDN
jgi:hypothetical protein